jgi:hypothetical protein
MGACVTPSQKDKYPKLNNIPLPNKSTIVQSRFKIQPRNSSPLQTGSVIQTNSQINLSTHNKIS